eukprot:UN34473
MEGMLTSDMYGIGAFPISEFQFGDTGDTGEQGILTVGQLKCRTAEGCNYIETDDNGIYWCIIEHSLIEPVPVNNAEDPFTFEIEPLYYKDIPDTAQYYCEINFRYDCIDSLFNSSSGHYAKWVGADGESYFWDDIDTSE